MTRQLLGRACLAAGLVAVLVVWAEVSGRAAGALVVALLGGYFGCRIALAAASARANRRRIARTELSRVARELGRSVLETVAWGVLVVLMISTLVFVPYGGAVVIGVSVLALCAAVSFQLGFPAAYHERRWRRIEPALDAWAEHAFSTEPADRALVEKLIAEIYEQKGRPAPQVEWATSPPDYLRRCARHGGDAICSVPVTWLSRLAGRGERFASTSMFNAAGEKLGTKEQAAAWQLDDELTAALLAGARHERIGELVEQASWFAFREEVAIVLERPVELHVDGWALHNSHGAAARFADGWALWALGGVVVPARAIEGPEGFDARSVLLRSNVEQRRVLIEHLGWERVVRAAGAIPTGEDDFGRLWRLRLELGGEEIVLVEVENATAEPDGTRRRYFLRVPPTVRTPREAVAWTFQLDPDEYMPELAS